MQAIANPAESAPVGVSPGPLIGLPRCLQLVGLGRTAWLDRVKAGTAPKPIKLGRRTLWVEAEVLAFVTDCVRRHREGVSA
jgi:predicted DNA-binding transcriptional regulator AlpA